MATTIATETAPARPGRSAGAVLCCPLRWWLPRSSWPSRVQPQPPSRALRQRLLQRLAAGEAEDQRRLGDDLGRPCRRGAHPAGDAAAGEHVKAGRLERRRQRLGPLVAAHARWSDTIWVTPP